MKWVSVSSSRSTVEIRVDELVYLLACEGQIARKQVVVSSHQSLCSSEQGGEHDVQEQILGDLREDWWSGALRCPDL